jgi:hypothetical protein
MFRLELFRRGAFATGNFANFLASKGETDLQGLAEFLDGLPVYNALYDRMDRSVLVSRLLDTGKGVRVGVKSWGKSDLETIIHWKHMQPLMARIEASNIESRLADAFRVKDGEERIEDLCSIPGVGPALASILLALTCPEEYAPLDSHAWKALCRLGFDLPSKPFSGGGYTIPELMRYLGFIRNLADEVKASPWAIAKALHALDKAKVNKKWRNELASLRSASKHPVHNCTSFVLGA